MRLSERTNAWLSRCVACASVPGPGRRAALLAHAHNTPKASPLSPPPPQEIFHVKFSTPLFSAILNSPSRPTKPLREETGKRKGESNTTHPTPLQRSPSTLGFARATTVGSSALRALRCVGTCCRARVHLSGRFSDAAPRARRGRNGKEREAPEGAPPRRVPQRASSSPNERPQREVRARR